MLRVLLADETLKPVNGAGWDDIDLTVAASCEEAMAHLENEPFAQLWVRGDIADAAGVTTLFQYLVVEDPWEGRSDVPVVRVLAPTREQAQPMIAWLKEHLPHYRVSFQPMYKELFGDNPAAPGGQTNTEGPWPEV